MSKYILLRLFLDSVIIDIILIQYSQGTAELREAFKKQENTLVLCQLIVSSANPQVFILDFYKYLLDVMNLLQ